MTWDAKARLTRGGAAGKAILIAGPTASGKSALAVALARQTGGTVVNADSVQVYADLRVLSSRPDESQQGGVPHRLFGHVDGGDTHSVGRWLAEAEAVLADLWAAGRLPILVGGTGLYFKALTQGLSAIPTVPEGVRARVRAAAEGVPPAALHARLAALDPAGAARLRPTDPQRILRALEVFEATGRPLAAFQGTRSRPLVAPEAVAAVFVSPERETLREAIGSRFARMVDEGALTEVAVLLARRLDPALPVMRALGVPQLAAHLQGEATLPEATAQATLQTWHYARRQLTFGRHQLPGFAPAPPSSAMAAVLAQTAGWPDV